MRPTDILFYGTDLSDFLQQRARSADQEIETYDANRLLNTSVEDLVAYFVEKYRVEPLALYEDQIETEQVEDQLDVKHDYRYANFDGGPHLIPATRVTFCVPFSGDPQLFQCQASTFGSISPRGTVAGSELRVSFTKTGDQLSAVQNDFRQALGGIRQCIGWGAGQVQQHNDALATRARTAIDRRRERLLQASQLTASLGFPMRRRANAPATYSVPVVKRKLAPIPPPASAGAFVPEPGLVLPEYEHILEIIQNMVLVMERSPSAFKGMQEESLRDHFLVQLNGQYEGQAMGETFNASGKTDILIRANGKNVFIAECKFWGGPATFTAAIDQLLSYTTWRDGKLALLVFNRNKEFTKVLDQLDGLLTSHTAYKRPLRVTGETRRRAAFQQPSDPSREVTLTVAAFDVPV